MSSLTAMYTNVGCLAKTESSLSYVA